METPYVPSDTPYSDKVYEPAEDSFLLLDALEQDLPKWMSRKDSSLGEEGSILALEVGCGSGIVSTALANFRVQNSTITPLVFAVDVNKYACELTVLTGERNAARHRLEVVNVNALQGNHVFRKELKFDLIVCNPPYVPVEQAETPENCKTQDSFMSLEKSWDGGPDGNAFIIPFLKIVAGLMSQNGVFYLLLSQWNSPDQLKEIIAKDQGLSMELVMSRSAGQERLSVWRLERSKS